MFTRILSVFRLLKRVGFAVLLLGSQAHAFDVIWNREGQGDSSRYGVWIIPLGDQNDDGFNDWGVFASGVRTEGPSHRYAEFFHGGNPPNTQPYMTWEYDANIVRSFGSMNPIGDINGDGYQDWINGMRYVDRPDSEYYEVFWGGPDADQASDFVLGFHYETGVFPYTIARPVGDFNGDSFDDIFVQIAIENTFRIGQIYYGGVTPDTIADWEFHTPPAPICQTCIESFGNLNGDSYSDFVSDGLFGANDSLWVFHGGVDPDTLPGQSLQPINRGEPFVVNDFNSDGNDDIALNRLGGIDLYYGSESIASTPDHTLNMSVMGSGPDLSVGLGDINGDGYGDIGAINSYEPSSWGTFALFLGSPWPSSESRLWITGRLNEWNLIGVYRAAGLGDVNGDGVDDFMVTGTNSDFDGMRGRALIFAGDTSYHVSAESAPMLPEALELSVFPNPFNSTTRIALSLPLHVQRAELRVHNLLGQEVLMQQIRAESGRAEFVLDGAGLATGVYLVSAHAGGMVAVRKVMVLK